jgi:hypothetical protein
MGTAKATICFGVCIEEWPWDDDYGWDEWWRGETGFVRQHRALYDADGEYLNGVVPSDSEARAYLVEHDEWDAAHPLPVEVVDVGVYDEIGLVLAVQGTVFRTDWDGPLHFDPDVMVVGNSALVKFFEFVRRYKLPKEEPAWMLIASYG